MKSFKMEQSQQNSGVVKASQPGGSEEGSQDGGSKEGSQDGGIEEGSQDGGLEEKSQEDCSAKEVKQDLKCPACEFHVSISKRGINELPQHLHLGFEAKFARYQFKIASAHEVPALMAALGLLLGSVVNVSRVYVSLAVSITREIAARIVIL